ncbi:MAG: PRC-barrel domain-containing protein [Dongiaceae bacterium]
MLRSLKTLRGFDIVATDGSIGDVYDFLFDDHDWTLRYVVVDTGKWLPGRKVVLSPTVVAQPDIDRKNLPVSLTRERIKEGPALEFHKPVSRQHEEQVSQHYDWPKYWEIYPAGMAAAPAMPGIDPVRAIEGRPVSEVRPERRPEGEIQGDPNLRSMREVEGYRISANDDEFGHVEDFLVDDEDWRIRYLVVDTRNWLPGRKVLIAQSWESEVNWADALVHIELNKEDIKASPEFDPDSEVNREYETTLFEHYRQPVYWP